MVNDTYFLKPNPDTTLTVLCSATGVISVGGYDNFANSIYSKSGRGFTIDDRVKPDMVAPAVNVFGPTVGREAILQGGFTRKTGIFPLMPRRNAICSSRKQRTVSKMPSF